MLCLNLTYDLVHFKIFEIDILVYIGYPFSLEMFELCKGLVYVCFWVWGYGCKFRTWWWLLVSVEV